VQSMALTHIKDYPHAPDKFRALAHTKRKVC
jgi:hypothetical protein